MRKSRGWAGRKGGGLRETTAWKWQVRVAAWLSCGGLGACGQLTPFPHPRFPRLSADGTGFPLNETAAVKCH